MRPVTMQVLRHSEQTLKRALISKNPALVSQYEKLDAREQQLMKEAFQPTSDLYGPIILQSQSDWIISHPEAPQDFEQFFSNPYRKIPSPEKHSIYLLAIGIYWKYDGFSLVLLWLCCQGWFGPLVYSSGQIFMALADILESSALVFPSGILPSFCGCFFLSAGVGIFSFARYGSNFYSSHYKGTVKKLHKKSSNDYAIFDNYFIPEITSVLLLRSCKTLSHEIGHIFGLRHCQWLTCLMQGSNHLEEADRRPLNLCPICLRKLQCAIGFNIAERYKALVRWIDDVNTPRATPKPSCEDNVHLPKPVEAFQDWKEWIMKCLAVLQK
uniref:archaemetzincin-2 n=1 Tax=Urocitellus parryii TaxID=9999 RepID=UPI000E55F973|nr:archaemetzincin-2 [Urocitellus parryii]